MRHRGIYLFPNLVTTGVLFAGFYGIVAAIDGNYPRSALALFIAMVLDGLDGRLARLTGTESEFGKQYDSLADLVAFGVAPAIIVYQWGLIRLAEYGWIWGKLGWLAAFLYAVSAALRLARFNVMLPSENRRFFEGLPSPSAAALVTFMVWLGTELSWSGGFALAFACAITSLAGALMVSHLDFYSFKQVKPGSRISFTFALAIPLTLVLISLDPPKVLFAMAAGYAISGPLVTLWRQRTAKQRDDHEASET
ncbi:MAG: CDP-diacylglycerol--serine O-phosphatidyltransferase [Gammaproteobacteria bacterium]|nr:CDP-diacylglycerol--serine O-phosphatidyltransferase [Gammaproteobacteria bacterium]